MSELILVYDPDQAKDPALHNLRDLVPGAEIVTVCDPTQYESMLGNNQFDLVILNYDLGDLCRETLFQELRLKDHEPGVLVVTESADPQLIARMYDAGCDRCIVKSGAWLDELGPAIRHLLRIRRLKEENLQIRAKLTEANHLLEEKNKRLDEFSMTVAHDIRGPLGGICMKLEYVMEQVGASLDARNQQLITRALDSSKRLTDIVQAMYEYAKLGSKAAKMSMLPLSQLVREVVGDLEFDEALDIKIGIGELPKMWGNAELLRRVFINLIGNAVKYNDKKEIIVNIGAQRFIQKSLARYVELFVEDNGPGIPKEDLAHLFAMFSRGTAPHVKKEGLGVGLAVVQRIVELHYGSVRVESTLGVGSKFILTLPIEKFDFVS